MTRPTNGSGRCWPRRWTTTCGMPSGYCSPTSTAAVDLSGCDALSRALDVAAGDTGALSGNEPLLIERIDAEYGRYFTPTGRPTGEWAAAITRLAYAETAVAECAATVAEVDARVCRHAELTEQVAELSQLRLAAGPRLVAAQAAADKIDDLDPAGTRGHAGRGRRRGDQQLARPPRTIGRLRLLTEIEIRTATVTGAEAEAQEAADAQTAARVDAEASRAAARKPLRSPSRPATPCRIRSAHRQPNRRPRGDRPVEHPIGQNRDPAA